MGGSITKYADKIIEICRELRVLLSNDSAFDLYKRGLIGKLQRLSLLLGEEEREDAVEWITVKNGEHVPIKDGKAVGGPLKGKDFKRAEKRPSGYSSPYPLEEISATGVNKPCIGFTKKNLEIHKSKHKGHYGRMTDEQYEEHARKLLQKKCGDDIWGYRMGDGCVCRFNRLTGEYAKGYPGGYIKTCFYPVPLGWGDRSDVDLGYAREYFLREKGVEAYDR